MNRMVTRVVFCTGLLLLATSSAEASPLFETLGNQHGPSGLNARFTQSSGSAATYYNPAMLSAAPDSIDVGFTVFQHSMNFTYFARPDSVDVPFFVNRVTFREPDGSNWQQLTLPTSILEGNLGSGESTDIPPRPRGNYNGTGDVINMATLGLTINVVPDYLVAGFYAFIPLGTYTEVQSWFSDERDQFFTNSLHATLYEDRMRAPTLAFGVSSNPIDELRIGLAFTLALKATAGAAAYAPEATGFQETIQLATDVGVIAKAAPHFSIVYEPLDELSISFTAHSPSKFEIETAFSAAFAAGGGSEDSATRTTVHDYMPWILGLGGEYRLNLPQERHLDFSAGVRFELWSNYIDRQGRTPSGIYEWSNIFVPSLGMTFRDPNFDLGLSAIYQPSPVPEQTGRTSFVDNDRIGATLTGAYKTRLVTLPLEIGLQVGAHKLLERSHQKVENPSSSRFSPSVLETLVRDEVPDNLTSAGVDADRYEGLQTNNPGYPGYRSDGALWNASLYLKIRY